MNKILALTLSSALAAGTALAKTPPTYPTAKGTFIQGWLAASYTDTQWQTEFNKLSTAGIQYVVLQTTLDEVTSSSPPSYSPTTMYSLYPSSISGVTYRGNTSGATISPVEECLKYAKLKGIKVLLGLNLYGAAWFGLSSSGYPFDADSYWCGLEAARGNAVADELYTLYKSTYSTTFYGWYWPWEVDNLNFTGSSAQTALVGMLNTNLDHLHTQDSSMVRLVSPFFNANLGGTYTASAYGSFWTSIFSSTHLATGDIFAPQDGVGAGHVTVAQVPTWFSSLNTAVGTKTGLTMWTNAETFKSSVQTGNGNYVSASLNRVVSQLSAESPYVSGFLTFAYSHYDSPQVVNPAFNTAWLAYNSSGTLSTTAPSAPSGITATGLMSGKVQLSWSTTPSVNGDAGFLIWRDGSPYDGIDIPTTARSSPATITYTDPDTSANGAHHVYGIAAFDAIGNQSSTTNKTGP